MMKRHASVLGLLVCCGAFSLVSSCRAFNNAYTNPEADLAAKPKVADAGAAGDASPKVPAGSGIDYSKDTTECKTPEGVTVGQNKGSILADAGWALAATGETVAVTATKLGTNSSAISIQKSTADKKSYTVTFTVKQTADDTFSACNFSYSDGPDRTYQAVSGEVMISQVNTVDEKAATVTNAGSFDLTFTRSTPTATKSMAFLSDSTPDASTVTSGSPELSATYFIDSIVEAAAK